MKTHESFNQSGFAKFINSPSGRVLRVIAGVGFIAAGYAYRDHTGGIISMVWGLFPLSAGLLDICYISAALGGPISGKKIRSGQLVLPL